MGTERAGVGCGRVSPVRCRRARGRDRRDHRSLRPVSHRRTRPRGSFPLGRGKFRPSPCEKGPVMAITVDRKTEIIGQFATRKGDNGSPEVQVALLSENIKNLTQHLATHRKDYTSRRGLLVMVGTRNKLLKYLRVHAPERYQSLIER